MTIIIKTNNQNSSFLRKGLNITQSLSSTSLIYGWSTKLDHFILCKNIFFIFFVLWVKTRKIVIILKHLRREKLSWEIKCLFPFSYYLYLLTRNSLKFKGSLFHQLTYFLSKNRTCRLWQINVLSWFLLLNWEKRSHKKLWGNQDPQPHQCPGLQEGHLFRK